MEFFHRRVCKWKVRIRFFFHKFSAQGLIVFQTYGILLFFSAMVDFVYIVIIMNSLERSELNASFPIRKRKRISKD